MGLIGVVIYHFSISKYLSFSKFGAPMSYERQRVMWKKKNMYEMKREKNISGAPMNAVVT